MNMLKLFFIAAGHYNIYILAIPTFFLAICVISLLAEYYSEMKRYETLKYQPKSNIDKDYCYEVEQLEQNIYKTQKALIAIIILVICFIFSVWYITI